MLTAAAVSVSGLVGFVGLMEIDGEEVTLESMAKAVFDLAFQVYESRGKFAVAAQLYDYGRAGEIRRVLDGDKPARIVMGPYTSEATAKTAGDALWRSNATDEHFKQGEEAKYTYQKTGAYSQLCSIHPEMLAYVFVGQNPYSAAVDAKGHYTIQGVPPGTYQLAVWNAAKLKAPDKSVTVVAGKTLQENVSIKR